ncbi:uncharacterized protein LOC133890308 [Phragmites australis]|uniref:uncharacterized protein LOC133890308 n=1 Tax=Phragmites australis TaxID=29695 RepID=UPI002D79321C|nr:uncharacterized protein LOC133890308 [Phragmites australis]
MASSSSSSPYPLASSPLTSPLKLSSLAISSDHDEELVVALFIELRYNDESTMSNTEPNIEEDSDLNEVPEFEEVVESELEEEADLVSDDVTDEHGYDRDDNKEPKEDDDEDEEEKEEHELEEDEDSNDCEYNDNEDY